MTNFEKYKDYISKELISMKVELQEKFNMSAGQVLVFKSKETVKIGDRIEVEGEEYTIEQFIVPSGAFDTELISAIVKR